MSSNIVQPMFLQEWDFDKNGSMPENIRLGSTNQVWWKCKKGHSWKASMNNRSKGSGCPYCSGRRPIIGENDLLTTNPEISNEWDNEKNTISPYDLKSGSRKKVWWKCEKGHSYQCEVYNKAVLHFGCPFCSGKRVIKGQNDLASQFPMLAEEWASKHNEGISPEEVMAKSGKQVWWECKNGHVWKASINNRVKGAGCPFCANRAGLYRLYHETINESSFITEWDFERNNELDPSKILLNDDTIVWWKCGQGHPWQASSKGRQRGQKCPYCADKAVFAGYNDFATKYPILIKEWDYEKNDIRPEQIIWKADKLVWWKCKHGHSWEMTTRRRAYGSGCLICAGKKIVAGLNDLKTTHPDLSAEWDYEKNGNLTPEDVMPGSKRIVWWKCVNGHEWRTAIHTRTRENAGGTNCPYCNLRFHTSFPEQAILFYVKQSYPDAINGYKDIFDNSMEIDIFIPSINTGIEYDGTAWHNSEVSDDKEKRKYLICNNNNIKLIRIKEKPFRENANDDADYIIPIETKPKHAQLEKMLHELSLIIQLRNDFDIERDKNNIREGFLYEMQGDSLATLYPEIAKEWNYERNGELTPFMFSAGSGERVWWKCSKGHEWEIPIHNRTSGANCPYCSNQKALQGYNDIQTTVPELLRWWDYDKNAPIKPSQVTAGSNKKYWWHCEKGHSFQATITDKRRAKDFTCPYCSGRRVLSGYNDLSTLKPELAREWNFKKNKELTPNQVTCGSDRKVWWCCEKGHEWQAKVNNRVYGRNCPYCSNKKVLAGYNDLLTIYPALAEEWDYEKNTVNPQEVSAKSAQKVWWKCKYGHEWSTRVYVRTYGSGCPICAKEGNE